MRPLNVILAVVGGALAGATLGLLFAPAKGSETRSKIAGYLRQKGLDLSDDEMTQLVDQITEEVKKETV